jgi:hypothetical protein
MDYSVDSLFETVKALSGKQLDIVVSEATPECELKTIGPEAYLVFFLCVCTD